MRSRRRADRTRRGGREPRKAPAVLRTRRTRMHADVIDTLATGCIHSCASVTGVTLPGGGPVVERYVAPVAVGDIEEALCEVSGIKAARVVTSTEHEIVEVHVLAAPDKAPKQIVRDIESAIMARFGIPVDHRRISIAQLGEASLPSEGEVQTSIGQRARIHSIHLGVEDLTASAVVTLDMDGKLSLGKASGPASQTGRMRIIAEAALDAVAKYAAGVVHFALEDVSMLQLGREKTAVACVQMMTPLGEQAFCGSALARGSEQDSIVRATLDAVNRRLTFLKTT